MAKRDLKDRMLGYLETLPVVDCHSHTWNPQEYARKDWTLFSLVPAGTGYMSRDMAGIRGETQTGVTELFEKCRDDAARWRLLKWYLEKTGNTSYWRHVVLSLRELFGLKDWELTDANWRGVNERIKRVMGSEKWYDEVTRKRCGIVTAVRHCVNFLEQVDRRYFTPVVRLDVTLRLWDDTVPIPEEKRRRSKKPAAIRRLEKLLNVDIGSPREARAVIRRIVSEHREAGGIGIKFGHAYWRTLYHDKVEDQAAGRILRKVSAGKEATEAEKRALVDWAFREAIAAAADLGAVVQIHTGTQTNWGHIPDSDPLNLLNLLRDFRSAKFDLFHAGYPYAREMGMLGKHYPNVWLNMCWMYLVSSAGSRQLLEEWLDLVPAHRLLGFGSDVHTPEMVYGHLLMARDCLAEALAVKVEKDYWSEERAREVGRMMLLENPCALYGIGTEQCKSAFGQLKTGK